MCSCTYSPLTMFVLGLFQVWVAEAVVDPCCEVQSANALLPSSFFKKLKRKKTLVLWLYWNWVWLVKEITAASKQAWNSAIDGFECCTNLLYFNESSNLYIFTQSPKDKASNKKHKPGSLWMPCSNGRWIYFLYSKVPCECPLTRTLQNQPDHFSSESTTWALVQSLRNWTQEGTQVPLQLLATLIVTLTTNQGCSRALSKPCWLGCDSRWNHIPDCKDLQLIRNLLAIKSSWFGSVCGCRNVRVTWAGWFKSKVSRNKIELRWLARFTASTMGSVSSAIGCQCQHVSSLFFHLWQLQSVKRWNYISVKKHDNTISKKNLNYHVATCMIRFH